MHHTRQNLHTYVCEQLFSIMNYVKNTHANASHTTATVLRNTQSDLIHRWFANAEPEVQEQKSHQPAEMNNYVDILQTFHFQCSVK